MERRKFILLALSTAPAFASSALVFQSCNTNYDSSLALPKQLTLIWDVETMIAMGKQYQQEFPGENSERKLVKLLIQNSRQTNGNPLSIEEKIIEDYKMEKTVLLDGWILSKTEARQCALFSIIHSNQ